MSIRSTVVLGLLVCTASAPSAYAQSTLTYQQALSMARRDAPRAAVARARIEEARGQLTGARLRFRENPVLAFSSGPRNLGSTTVTDYEVVLGQTFDVSGQRAARIARADAAVAREVAIAEATTRTVVHDVAAAFTRVLHAQLRLETLRTAEALAYEALAVAERRNAPGDAAVMDVNVARAAVAKAKSLSRAAEAERLVAVGELRALLGWKEAADPVLVGSLHDSIRDALNVTVSLPEGRPEVVALHAEAAEARADRRIGTAMRAPLFGVDLRINREEMHRSVLAGVSLTIPLFNRGQDQEAASVARARRTELERAALATELDVRAKTARAAFELRLSALEPLERDVLPALQHNERLARRDFDAGELSMSELLAIRREAVDVRLEYIDALRDAAMASIAWQSAAGSLR